MPEMTKSPTDEEKYQMIEEAVRQPAAEGLIYDTGHRRWSKRTQTYQIVWAAVPPKQQRS
jgi:hypothetical protein